MIESICQLFARDLFRPFTLIAVMITFCVMAQVLMAESRGGGSSMAPDPCAYYACGTCSDQTTMFCSNKPLCETNKCSDVIDLRSRQVPRNGSVDISPRPNLSTLRDQVKQPQSTKTAPVTLVSPKDKPAEQHQQIKSVPPKVLQEKRQHPVGTIRSFDEADAIFGKRSGISNTE